LDLNINFVKLSISKFYMAVINLFKKIDMRKPPEWLRPHPIPIRPRTGAKWRRLCRNSEEFNN
jgi:hypothetical protein